MNSSPIKRPVHVVAQQSLRLDTGEGALGVLDIDAALIMDFAVQRPTEVASRALQCRASGDTRRRDPLQLKRPGAHPERTHV